MSKKILSIIILLLTVFSAVGLASPDKISAASKLLEIPAGFTIDTFNEKDVILLWEEPTDERVTDFAILRQDASTQDFKEIARIPATTQTYIDETVEVGQTYTYRVQSIGAGYTSADTEPKTILVQTIQNTIVTTPDPASADAVDKLAQGTIGKVVGDQEPDKFLTNLVAVDLLVLGLLLIIYMLLRGLVIKRNKKMNYRAISEAAPVTKKVNEGTKPEFVLKTGHKDKNIIQAAKQRFLAKRKKSIKDWEVAN